MNFNFEDENLEFKQELQEY